MTNASKQVITIDNNEDMKEAIKPMFYLLTGKPDNLFKIYDRDVIITPESIRELNEMVHEKLDHFEVNGLVFTATIAYQNNKVIEFGNWNEFDLFRWNIPDVTKSIVIKWDFLISLPEYGAPQRHSITLRIAQGTSQKEMLMLMLNNNIEELENIDLNNSPIFCRVDFINTLLGTEIIELIDRWNKSRKRPTNHSRLSTFFYKKRRLFANIIEHSFPIFVFILILSSINFMVTTFHFENLSSEAIKPYLYWLVIVTILFTTCKKGSYYLAKKFYSSIVESRQYNIFRLTNGDYNKQQEIEKITSAKSFQFIISISLSLFINVSTGLISAYLLQLIG